MTESRRVARAPRWKLVVNLSRTHVECFGDHSENRPYRQFIVEFFDKLHKKASNTLNETHFCDPNKLTSQSSEVAALFETASRMALTVLVVYVSERCSNHPCQAMVVDASSS